MSTKTTINEEYYQQSIKSLVQLFNTDPKNGLKISELEQKYQEFGYNELPKVRKSIWKIYLAPIFNFLIVILLITGVIIIILGSPEDTIITFTVVIINSATAIIQQYRAQKALESLRKISALKATVIRDGVQMEILTKDLVPGDIILLNQGDKIPADGRIIEEMNLTIDEAPLTGESEPVQKSANVIEKSNIPIQKQKNMVFMGTYVRDGRAKAIITGTGVNTQIGKISETLNEMGSIEEIPLTKKLNRLGYILGTIVIINLIILITTKLTLLSIYGEISDQTVSEALVNSILRAMNVMPINLPLLTTLVLITGVLNMAQSGVIIKNLSSIESLGRVSVICSDKTGTITKNEMTVEKFWLNEEEFTVTGTGYDADGQILKDGKKVDLKGNPTFQKFIESIVINNNAKLVYEDVKVRVKGMREKAIRRALGSPTEAALLVLAEKAGFVLYDIEKKLEIMKEYSFSSEIKRMTTVCNLFEEKFEIYAFIKGAPEKILEISTEIETNGTAKPLEEDLRNLILNSIQKHAKKGYRTLAIGYRKLKSFDGSLREDIEKNIVFLGFVSIMDPPRLGVENAVRECQAGNIKVIMITGDHPATAKTIASHMGIYRKGDLVIEGHQIKNLSKEDFEKASVFARVAPTDKELIVEHYQNLGKIVAMTGDGINDTPALKLANAGIAMGITGTDLAKETADMVISDDNFVSIEEGVRVGRGLFSKIRTIIYFFICLNIMEAIIFFSYELGHDFLAVSNADAFKLFASNWQHIYIFGIVHSFPSLALVLDTHPKDIMNEPPRNEEEILNKNMWIMLLLQAFFMGLGLVLILQLTILGVIPLNEWNLNPNLSYIPENATMIELQHMKARTMFITTLYIVEVFFIWTFRRPNKSIIESIKNEFSFTLFFICMFTLTIHILVIMSSYQLNYYINDVYGLDFQLNFMFLSATDWLLCVLFALPGLLGIEVFKYLARKRNVFF
ncbi:MAG: cation-translocating P-type ATPase [Promethearchaeota archaeon]